MSTSVLAIDSVQRETFGTLASRKAGRLWRGSAQMGRRSSQSVNEVDGSDQFQKAESPLHRLDSKGAVKRL